MSLMSSKPKLWNRLVKVNPIYHLQRYCKCNWLPQPLLNATGSIACSSHVKIPWSTIENSRGTLPFSIVFCYIILVNGIIMREVFKIRKLPRNFHRRHKHAPQYHRNNLSAVYSWSALYICSLWQSNNSDVKAVRSKSLFLSCCWWIPCDLHSVARPSNIVDK